MLFLFIVYDNSFTFAELTLQVVILMDFENIWDLTLQHLKKQVFQ